MKAIDLAVFCDKNVEVNAPIGSVVSANVQVSSYDTRSLTTNGVTLVDDEALTSWWASLSSPTFDNLSVGRQPSAEPPAPPPTPN